MCPALGTRTQVMSPCCAGTPRGRPTRELAADQPENWRAPKRALAGRRGSSVCALPSRVTWPRSLTQLVARRWPAGSVLLFFFLIGRVLFLTQFGRRFCLGLIQCDEFSGAVYKSHLTSPPGMGSPSWFLFFRDQCKWRLGAIVHGVARCCLLLVCRENGHRRGGRPRTY